MKTTAFWLVSLCVLFSGFSLAQSLPVAAQQPTLRSASFRIHVTDQYGKLPMSFEANQGQTDPQVKFLSRGNGYSLFLTPTEAVLELKKTARGKDADPGLPPSQALSDRRRAEQPPSAVRVERLNPDLRPRFSE